MKSRSPSVAQMLRLPLLWLAWISFCSVCHGRTFHVDASAGADDRDGLSVNTAWRSLERVNAAELKPGDQVLFKRGETWRGQLVPQSGADGAPIAYGAYGMGPKPQLLGSVAMNRPEDWRNEGGSIWTTVSSSTEQDAPADLKADRWSLHTEGGAKIAKSVEGASLRLLCETGGTASHHAQLYLPCVAVEAGGHFVFAFRAQSSIPFVLSSVALSKATKPWTSYGTGPALHLEIGTNAGLFTVRFRATQTAGDARLTFHLGGVLPAGAQLSIEPVSWRQQTYAGHEPITVDVGNIIFDGGPVCGVKKWSAAELKQPGDYWYSAADGQVRLHSEGNPAASHRSIELALTRHIINEGGRHHVTYENLALRYGAAHGIGGGDTHHIVVRHCDIGFIGGGHQHTRPDGRPVRYGNGIEFWAAAHDHLVEGCRIWEIYDAALTNQGDDHNEERDITYRDNVICNSEYSFEYWNRKNSRTRDILFEHNTCFGAGYGWGHAQRPDRNGRHLMFYSNTADTQGVVIRHNIFSEATDSCLRMENDWTAGLALERNCWFQSQGALVLFLKKTYGADQFDDFRKQSGLDAGSIVADPQFRDVRTLDFRLADASPANRLTPAGTLVGARQRLAD